MSRRRSLLAAFAWTGMFGGPAARAQDAVPPPPDLKPLGQDRYQIGRIVLDKRARRFTVAGRVHALGKPLEFLATTSGGAKAYESLFEVDATGTEFNLACILAGLERDPKHIASRRSGPGPLLGPRVAIFVTWSDGGVLRRMSAAEAVLNPDAGVKPESVEWVYTGSPISDGRERFAADVTGTLIAIVPKPTSVIEAAVGIGVGAYGGVHGNPLLPPNGTPIELIVDASGSAK